MKTVAISLLGTVLDQRGRGMKRWDKWRPTVSLFQHEDLLIDRLDLVFQARDQGLANIVSEDIQRISPETTVKHHLIEIKNPWDFEQVYSALHDFSRAYRFKTEQEDYLIHITTGTHVAQICLYLLTEARYLPGRLIQTSPPSRLENRKQAGDESNDSEKQPSYQIIDLDLSKYDQIASRFSIEHHDGAVYLKGGIATLNKAFNHTITQITVGAAHLSTQTATRPGLGQTGGSELRHAAR